MSGKLVIRDIEDGDEPALVRLLSPYWQHLRDEAAFTRWSWEYHEGPHRAVNIVAEHEGRIVGHYALLPLDMKCERERILGAKAEGLVVHSDYRGAAGQRLLEGPGTSVLHAMVTAAFDRAATMGIRLIWGFPNQPALRGQVKAGYGLIAVRMSHFVVPINLARTARLFLAAKSRPSDLRAAAAAFPRSFDAQREREAPGGPQVESLTDGAAELSRLWSDFDRENDCVTIERSPAYVRWRFSANPVVEHTVLASRKGDRLTAYVATAAIRRRRTVEGRIVDMLGLDANGDDLRHLLIKAVGMLRQQDADFVVAQVTDVGAGVLCRRALSDAGFLPLRRTSIEVLVKTFDLDPGVVTVADRWFITPAFTEGVS